MTDAVLQQSAMKCLVDRFGTVEAERFISIIIRDGFDYTEWQKDLFADLSVEELSKMAMDFRRNKNSVK